MGPSSDRISASRADARDSICAMIMTRSTAPNAVMISVMTDRITVWSSIEPKALANTSAVGAATTAPTNADAMMTPPTMPTIQLPTNPIQARNTIPSPPPRGSSRYRASWTMTGTRTRLTIGMSG